MSHIAAVMFYQISTFSQHAIASLGWIVRVVLFAVATVVLMKLFRPVLPVKGSRRSVAEIGGRHGIQISD
ncbi:hypothetical protein NG796_03800 [Laspinema sp. A4]|uniref:hypothetical protein n=1 Tax=Laspinema sp. D2d TaxID=2953686 RepID=UPI0021BB4AC5|nr:hypothetical protein [Laspinema sp. D2d]MCT7982409.1 hypothetical protein [Laspinema sp. D2d]